MKGISRTIKKWIWIIIAVLVAAGIVVAVVKTLANTHQRRMEAAETSQNCKETFLFNGTVYSLVAFGDKTTTPGNRQFYALCSMEEKESSISLMPYYEYAWCDSAGQLLYTQGKTVGLIDPVSGDKKALLRLKKGRNVEIDGIIGEYALLHGVAKTGNSYVRVGEFVLLNILDGSPLEIEIDILDTVRIYPLAVIDHTFYFLLSKTITNDTTLKGQIYSYDMGTGASELIDELESATTGKFIKNDDVCMLDGHIYLVLADGSLLNMLPGESMAEMALPKEVETVSQITVYDGDLWILTSQSVKAETTDFRCYCFDQQVGDYEEIFSFERNGDFGLTVKLSVTDEVVVVSMSKWKQNYVWRKGDNGTD